MGVEMYGYAATKNQTVIDVDVIPAGRKLAAHRANVGDLVSFHGQYGEYETATVRRRFVFRGYRGRWYAEYLVRSVEGGEQRVQEGNLLGVQSATLVAEKPATDEVADVIPATDGGLFAVTADMFAPAADGMLF